MVGVFERVYEIGPVFRAEPHDTVRHLAEYVSLDAEFGFIRDHRDVIAMLRDVLAGMVAGIHEYAARRGRAHRRRRARGARGDPGDPLPRRPRPGRRTRGRARPGSRARARARRVGARPSTAATSSPSRATRWSKRPFYTHPQPDDPRWSNSFDLIFRGLELVTGGQRLHRPSDYDAAIRANGEDPAAYAAYLQAFQHGMPPARRLRDRTRAVDQPADRQRQRARGHALPAGPEPTHPVNMRFIH